ncbi:hypothetical protein [Streptomyces sp. NPDC058280]|uniref:hypothetical protein n=1 Tax=Streptomyces sp. NPDC058280 TaxID=3346419 RepID=UPI0036ECBC15
MVELLTGLPPDAPAGARVKSECDPACRSLAERERAKAAELAALGEEVTARTVKRKRQQYEPQVTAPTRRPDHSRRDNRAAISTHRAPSVSDPSP